MLLYRKDKYIKKLPNSRNLTFLSQYIQNYKKKGLLLCKNTTNELLSDFNIFLKESFIFNRIFYYRFLLY